MTDSDSETELDFDLKRVDCDGQVIKGVTLKVHSKSSVDDLIESSRNVLGFSQNDFLTVRYENSKHCIERTLELKEVDNSRSLIISEEDETADQDSTAEIVWDSKIVRDTSDAQFVEHILTGTNISNEVVTERIVTLLADMSSVQGLEHDVVVRNVLDHNRLVIKYESFQSEEERRETQDAEDMCKIPSDDKSSNELEVEDLELVELNTGEADGEVEEFLRSHGLKSTKNHPSKLAIVTKTVNFYIKKCEVEARLNDYLSKKLQHYIISHLDCSVTNIKTCAKELEGILKEYSQSCNYESEILEGTFMLGGRYRAIATITSSENIEFDFLAVEALQKCKAVDETGTSLSHLKEKNLSISTEDLDLTRKETKDFGQNLNQEDLTINETIIQTRIRYEINPQLNTINLPLLRERLKDPNHWMLFPTENLQSITLTEVRKRDKVIGLVADIMNYDDAADIERLRVNCLWEILKSCPSESCQAGDIWQRLAACAHENDMHLEKLRILVEMEMRKSIPEFNKALNILRFCERTRELIGIDGSKSVALSLFKMPSFQPFLIKILDSDGSCAEEQRTIFEGRIEQEFLIHLDTTEVELDPFSDKYQNHGSKNRLLNKHIKPDVDNSLNNHNKEVPKDEETKDELVEEELMAYHDLFVDRPYHEDGSECLSKTTIVDRLKFRTDVFKRRESFSFELESDSASSVSSTPSCNDFDSEDEEKYFISENPKRTKLKVNKLDPFHVLLEVLKQGNLSVKQEVFRRLLEQRYSVPLFFQYISEDRLISLTDALMFSKVKYLKKFRSLDQDINLPRIVFLSECDEIDLAESMDLASHIFRCRFGSRGSDMKNFSTMSELTVGFLGGQNQDTECPWMVLHVQGDYKPLLSCLQQFKPDVVLVEVNAKSKNYTLQKTFEATTQHVLSWSSNKCRLKYDKKRKLFVGQFNQIVEGITDCLGKLQQDMATSKPGRKDRLKAIEGNPKQETLLLIDVVEKSIITSKIGTLKDRLTLQESFQKQGWFHRNLAFERNTERRDSLMVGITEEETFRATKALMRNQEFLLDVFCNILRTEDKDSRFILANCFEVCIDEQSNLLLDSERKNVSQAYEMFSESQKPDSVNRESSNKFKKLYYDSKRRFLEKSVGIENIWRELIHSYESAPLQNEHLPGMAAQYLMDGFVLELLDGDTGILCTKWTNALFQALQKRLDELIGKEVNVFVLSIMGTQSTGKSTLLNIMFGCRMRVSAGQCTKGVYIQLIKSEFNERYDYVLILDTEGLRAPEFFGESWSIWKDNRMATLSVLSADATIVTAVNEDDIAIREVVPIVLLAHKRSKIAEENSGRQPTKLFFAYNRVDTTNLSKFLENRQSLHRTLRDAEREMADYGRQDYKSFLASFNTSDDESKSDIKYFGLLNKGGSPPDDTPNFEFGRKVASFRKYIDKHTNSRTFQTLVEWSEHIQLVYSCLESTNFELSFRSAMEHKAFNEYEKKQDEIKQTVAKAFYDAFSKVESDIMKIDVDPKKAAVLNLEHFFSQLDCLVQPIVIESSKKVEEILEQNKYDSFREGRKQAFRNFVQTLKADKYEKIRMTCNGRFNYQMEKQEYQERICHELQREIDQDSSLRHDELRQDEIFNRIFLKKLKDCSDEYPGIDVREQIESVYAYHDQLTMQNHVHHNEAISLRKKLAQVGEKFLSGAFDFITGKPWSNESNEGAELLKLEGKISELIYHEKSFDIAFVHKIIHLTYEATKRMDAQVAYKWNQCTKEFIIRKLEGVQKTWEHGHNIAARLEAEKEVLKHNFKNVICKEIFGKDRAIQQISDGLIYAMNCAFINYLSSKVLIAVQDMGWVMDSKILQAHVDLKYLELSKAGKERDLIEKLCNSESFYGETVLEKISEFVNKYEVNEWKNLVEKTREAVEQSGFEASRITSDGYKKMKEVLKNELDPKVLKFLPEITMWDDGLNGDLNRPEDSVNSIFLEIKDAIKKRIIETDKPRLDMEACSEEVYRLLCENHNPGARPRCTAVCPRCRLPCNKSIGHYSEDSRHNCDHQATGLVGNKWIGSKKLVGFSCAESVSRGDAMVFPDKEVPYAEFDKKFPEWMLPSEATATSRVRKYLFQRHNKALAQYYDLIEPDIDNLNPLITASHEEMVHETLEKTKK